MYSCRFDLEIQKSQPGGPDFPHSCTQLKPPFSEATLLHRGRAPYCWLCFTLTPTWTTFPPFSWPIRGLPGFLELLPEDFSSPCAHPPRSVCTKTILHLLIIAQSLFLCCFMHLLLFCLPDSKHLQARSHTLFLFSVFMCIYQNPPPCHQTFSESSLGNALGFQHYQNIVLPAHCCRNLADHVFVATKSLASNN